MSAQRSIGFAAVAPDGEAPTRADHDVETYGRRRGTSSADQHQADREHPQSEDRQDCEKPAEDQDAGHWQADSAEASVKQRIDDAA